MLHLKAGDVLATSVPLTLEEQKALQAEYKFVNMRFVLALHHECRMCQ